MELSDECFDPTFLTKTPEWGMAHEVGPRFFDSVVRRVSMGRSRKETKMGLSNLRMGLWIFCVSISVMVLLLVMIPFGNAWSADAPPTFTLVGPGLKLENGASRGKAQMLLKVDGLNTAGMSESKPPDIIDQQIPESPLVVVKFSAKEMQRGTSSRTWLLVAEVDGLPSNTMQKRFLQVKFQTYDPTLDYALTNKYDTVFSWTLKQPPSEISIRTGEAIEIGITVGPVPATNVRVLQANLIEKSRKFALAPAGLILCKNPQEKIESEITLLPNSANRLWLRTKEDSYPVGIFSGSVKIAASEKPDGDTFNLTLYSTRGWAQILGVLAIFVGVIISIVVLGLGRYRLNRNQLLLPAVFIRQKLSSLQIILEQAPDPISKGDTPKTSAKLVYLLEQLSEPELVNKGYIPPVVSALTSGTAQKLEEYRTLLKKMDDWAWVLRLIISDGMAAAWGRLSNDSPKPAQDAVIQTIKTFDDLATGDIVPSSDTVSGTIKTELDKLKVIFDNPNNKARLGGRSLEGMTPAARSYEQLNLETQYISYALLIFMALLTTLLGSYIFVFSNLGFGLWTDYLVCLFWGFGLPTGGTKLAEMTTSSLANTLGISITTGTKQ